MVRSPHFDVSRMTRGSLPTDLTSYPTRSRPRWRALPTLPLPIIAIFGFISYVLSECAGFIRGYPGTSTARRLIAPAFNGPVGWELGDLRVDAPVIMVAAAQADDGPGAAPAKYPGAEFERGLHSYAIQQQSRVC